MWPARLCLLLCVSVPSISTAAAEDMFVTQLRLPARGVSRDVFAWRDGGEIYVAREDLNALSIAPAGDAARVRLSSIAGLSFSEDNAGAAITLTCTADCFAPQRLGTPMVDPSVDAAPWGAYVNYDLAAQWIEGGDRQFASVMEATVFGPAGRFETGWLADRRVVRLETRWTMDYPDQRLRLVVGDASAPGIGGGMLRLGGIQLGRRFELAPGMITHPTPMLSGEAESASTVELYIDGALRAREQVQAGPFIVDEGPFITGAGEAQLVVTDALGRQQVIARPFFISADMLRPGLSDWSIAVGAVREEFIVDNFSYGAAAALGRYRLGVTPFLTLESALEIGERGSAEIGAVFATPIIGQVRVTHARGESGGAASVAWFRDARVWSFGVQAETREAGFATLTRDGAGPRQSAAAHLNLQIGGAGALAFTAAAADYDAQPDARTLSLAYTPDWFDGASLRFRLAYTERTRAELAFGMSFSLALPGGPNTGYGAEWDRRGASYRVGAQSPAPPEGGFGWRARSVSGVQQRVELTANHTGPVGESAAQAVRFDDGLAARFSHAGAVGWIDGYRFAGAPVRGAFALIDVGAPDVEVTRDGLGVGRSGRDGRVLAANLRPYEVNAIGIETDNLPFDRAPAGTQMRVTPREGAGVVVRFDNVEERLQETQARFADGAPAPRGAILLRARDGARFPVGRDGRVVIAGAAVGDVVTLQGQPQCVASANPADARGGLTLMCAGAA